MTGAAHFGAAYAETAGPAPRRVVSMNLCTDQLAMLLAAKGQLLSVSHLASDRRSSAMVKEAGAYVTNHGRAEEIYLLRPDLVIAGAYSSKATVRMLKRLGVPVAVIQPARSLSDVRARIKEIGALLGQDEKAGRLAQRFERDLAELRQTPPGGPRAALYAARGWTSGPGSLAGQILLAAGFRNIAGELGLKHGGTMPLEVLAMAQPDMVISSTPYKGHSRAEEILLHPVIETYRQNQTRANMRDSDWVCGTPYVLRAIHRLIEDRTRFEAGVKK